MPTDHGDRFHALATTLAAMPDLWRALLAEHRDDGHGRCTGCTVAGTGRPGEHWPCNLTLLAREARRVAERD